MIPPRQDGDSPGEGETQPMNELDTLLSGITEDKVYQVVVGLVRGQPRKRRARGAMLYRVVEALVSDWDLATQAEYDCAVARVREAAIEVVKQSNRMAYLPNR